MKKPIIFVLFFGLLLLLALPSMAAESPCTDCAPGQFNGQPACLKGDKLHICVQNFPDNAFGRFISTYIDKNRDGMLSTEECETETMTVFSNVVSLDGIAFFPSLRKLVCNNNTLTSLALQELPELVYLDCSNNNISSLDLSKNSKLEYLNCSSNVLQELDVRNCAMLKEMDCSRNHLITLDLSKNFYLTDFRGSQQSVEASVTAKDGLLYLDICKLVGTENFDRVKRVYLGLHPGALEYDEETGIAVFYGTQGIHFNIKTIFDPAAYSEFHSGTSHRGAFSLSVNVHINCPHNWRDPSCYSKAKCTLCHAIDWNSPLAHTFTDVTCTADSVCTKCGFVNKPALGHSESSWTIETEATWDEPGLKIRNCTHCGIQLESKPVRAIKDTPKGEYILSMQALERSVKITRVFDLLTFAAVILSLLITIITDLLPPRKKHEK